MTMLLQIRLSLPEDSERRVEGEDGERMAKVVVRE